MAKAPTDIFAATSPNAKGDRVLIITADGTEDTEFFYPYYRLIEEGFAVDVATPKGSFKGKNGSGLNQTKTLDDVSAQDYVMLYVPGGKAPEALKQEDPALSLVQAFAEKGKTIAAICHGAQLLAEADVIQDQAIAGWPEIEAEVQEAGATFMKEETVVDGNFITARWPGDLPSFTKAMIKTLRGRAVQSKAA